MRIWKRAGAIFLSLVMALSLMVSPAMAEGAAPTKVTYRVASAGWDTYIYFTYADSKDSTWFDSVSEIRLNGTAYEMGIVPSVTFYDAYGNHEQKALKIQRPNDVSGDATVTLVAPDGAIDIPIKVSDYSSGTVTATPSTSGEPDPEPAPDDPEEEPQPGTISLNDLSLSQDFFRQQWYISVPAGYAENIRGVSVNDTAWESSNSDPSAGGKYRADVENRRLVFAAMNFSSSSTVPILKSGDVITVTAEGYNDLTFKFVVSPQGQPSLESADQPGDGYTLHAQLRGSFEAAIAGQEYDAVSGATGVVSTSKNSAANVYAAYTQSGQAPAEDDWKEADSSRQADKINLDGTKCAVKIVPDTAKGTPETADSGMKGVFMPAISSSVSLSGTPKDVGQYLISVSVTDSQGRTAETEPLPFRIYSGQEKLADQLVESNLRQYQSGLYAWDIMEPWAIRNFGSNVSGQSESVRVPEKLEAWFGSHESGLYGYLGYDIPWSQVQSGDIPQTLYIPKGCDLTIENMSILSSVRVVVESGGTLRLLDSTIQGVVDVQSGGTFSINYDAFNQKFRTGGIICGQVRLADGAILENSAIYSHTNYLANGGLTDRSNADPVVVAQGSVTLKGQVFIHGDSAGGTPTGQTALLVQDGTLTLEDGATLAAYGGDGKVTLYPEGGKAIALDGGKIQGNGTVIAIGGPSFFGSGGAAVGGNGSIQVSEVFLHGGNLRDTHVKNQTPGKAVSGNVRVDAPKGRIRDGETIDTVSDDPNDAFRWVVGVDATPPLTNIQTTPGQGTYVPADTELDSGKSQPKNDEPAPTEPTPTEPDAPAVPAFRDVESGSWYAAAVQWAYEAGITKGIGDDSFGPYDRCTRAQLVTFLWRHAGSPKASADLVLPFTDVKQGDFSEAIRWAYESGIAKGIGGGLFAPDDACTRGQFVTFLWRYAGSPSASGGASFTDVSKNAFYADAVAWAAAKGITKGIGGGLFGPDDLCDRAQAVTFLHRTFGG